MVPPNNSQEGSPVPPRGPRPRDEIADALRDIAAFVGPACVHGSKALARAAWQFVVYVVRRWSMLDTKWRIWSVCTGLAAVFILALLIFRESGPAKLATNSSPSAPSDSQESESSTRSPQSTTSPAAPRLRYTIIDLGTLGGNSADAAAINNNGQVVGNSGTKKGDSLGHAFLWQAGVGMARSWYARRRKQPRQGHQ